jgi:cell wall-associated NlpC family hydrolase
MKLLLGAFGAAGIVFAILLGLATIGATSSATAAAGSELCITRGGLAGLSSIAAANARTVAAVAEQRLGTAGAVIAVMVGYTESGLRVLGNPNVAGGTTSPQGTGTNLDSLGIFQQRGSWGTAAQRMDPVASTRMFVTRLAALHGWQGSAPWVAAQGVQRSAYDGTPRAANSYSGVVGGNYKSNFKLAQHAVQQIDNDTAHARCGALSGGLPANSASGSHGLPSQYRIPASASPAARVVISFALAQLDKPYVFGAAGPTAFDCSGLTLAAWSRAVVTLPHDAAAQSHIGGPTTEAALTPGDLIFVPGDDGTLTAPGHVGIYIGRGLVVNAADERDGIRVQTFQNFVEVGHGLAALRHLE